jgi:hypothetical protein
MGNVKRHFIKGRMNKSVDERLVPNGEYINALNVRLGSTEGSEVGSVENSKGNTKLTTLQYKGVDLSISAQCIGSFEDGVNETIYWFMHDGSNATSSTGVVDMIVSYNTNTDLLLYHVVSTSVLNFNPTFLITGVNKVEDLLFFTDDINPPRKINVTSSYLEPTPGHVDQITQDDISVIKRPPRKAPTLQLIDVPGEENYLETNFVSFAYRYKYVDNEYSALSQFTDVAFESSPFSLDPDTNFNDGMLNRYNTAVVGVNTGGDDVIGIDICFKLGNDSDIRVMQKYIKEEAGWPSGIVQTVNFTNQQIYTLLPSSEILRLYDNVPLVAQSQTVMGNRLMYGNYEDGYDLTTTTGGRINTSYTANLISENLSVTQGLGDTDNLGSNYTIDTASTVTPTDAQAVFNFASEPLTLVQGGVFGFSFTVSSQGFSGTWSGSSIAHPTFTASFVFNLPQSYNNIFEMVNSAEFIAQLGSNLGGSFQPVGNCSSGSTFTDIYNCAITPPAEYSLVNTGVTAGSQGVFLSSDINNNEEFKIQILAAQYALGTDNQNFEYFSVSNVSFSFQTESSNKSLHSNRDYEVGIVYMDEYKRASTTLTSSQNTVFVPAVNSSVINRIRTTIPINMTAPSWADTYKFVLKQSRGGYDTIYSTTYYYDPSTTSYWFRLVGQDQALVEAGTELIVKTDGGGTLSDELKVTVLDKVSQPTNFLHLLQEGSDILEVPGLYMRLRAQGFSIDTSAQNICYPQIDSQAPNDTETSIVAQNLTGYYQGQAIVNYPLYIGDSSSSSGYSQIPVPSGSVVRVKIKFRRDNVGFCGGNNGAELCQVNKTFTSSQTYSNIRDFWYGDGLSSVIPASMNCEVSCQDDSGENSNVFLGSVVNPVSANSTFNPTPSIGTNQMLFYEIDEGASASERRLFLRCINGSQTQQNAFETGYSITKVEFCIQEPGSLVAFETVPNEIADGVFFEGSENYDIVGGYHQGNVTNQDATTEGVVDLDFFNCYSFGNGVESYKIEDSSIGQSFALGERTILVSAQDFKRADRFADITYSGVYNDESNVNKLNEFNLGLLNFKTLEDVYGPIQKMVARETDILVLQEDRISYVLANKNAVTDAEGGNILTAAPLILGQQVARVEEYGISANPESYAEFGMDKYFTDAKRGSVIQLRGSSFSNEQLSVVSQSGMRSYFRDLFNDKFNTQKLGGYDPYMDEYVISSNENKLPVDTACVNCDISQTINLAAAGDTSEFCVNVGGVVGDVVIEWSTPALGPGVGATTFSINANYSGTDYPSGNITTAGTLTIAKNSVNPNTVAIVVTANGGSVTNLNFTVNCPVGNELKIIQVALNLNWQDTKSIHNEFRFVDGTTESSTYSQGVVLGTGSEPVVSQYQELTGLQGTTVFPPNGSTVYVQVRKQSGDTFNYDPTAASSNKLQYLRSNTLYENNSTDINALLTASSSNVLTVTPSALGSLLYTGNFTMPNNSDDYLYLIYDYRLAQSADLCSGATSAAACCSCGALTTFYLDASNLSSATSVYTDEALTTLAPDQFYSQLVNGNDIVRQQSAGVLLPATSCASCDRKCTDPEPVPAPSTPALAPRTVYDITYDLASGVGVVPIRFTPGGGTGIFATYNNTVTSKSSATTITDGGNPNSSYFDGPYYGDDSVCNPSTGTTSLPLYNWDEINEDFDDSGTTESITIQASDLTSLTTGAAGSYVLYVSKTSATPSTMDLRIVSACSTGVPTWSVDVDCPRILTGFASSAKASTEVDICTLPIDSTLYNLPVLTPNAFGIPAVRDWVFKDNLGEDVADDGYYKLSGGALGCTYIRVVNGVIVTKVN